MADTPTTTLTPVTYSDLVHLVNSQGLIPGKGYLITDFQTIYTQPETNDVIEGYIEPIVVVATTNKDIATRVQSTIHPSDIILYSLKGDDCDWNTPNSKGQIISRKDVEYENEAPYDFRAIYFPRSMVTENDFIQIPSPTDQPIPEGGDTRIQKDDNILYAAHYLDFQPESDAVLRTPSLTNVSIWKPILSNISALKNNHSQSEHDYEGNFMCLPVPGGKLLGRPITSSNSTHYYTFNHSLGHRSRGNTIKPRFVNNKRVLNNIVIIFSNNNTFDGNSYDNTVVWSNNNTFGTNTRGMVLYSANECIFEGENYSSLITFSSQVWFANGVGESSVHIGTEISIGIDNRAVYIFKARRVTITDYAYKTVVVNSRAVRIDGGKGTDFFFNTEGQWMYPPNDPAIGGGSGPGTTTHENSIYFSENVHIGTHSYKNLIRESFNVYLDPMCWYNVITHCQREFNSFPNNNVGGGAARYRGASIKLGVASNNIRISNSSIIHTGDSNGVLNITNSSRCVFGNNCIGININSAHNTIIGDDSTSILINGLDNEYNTNCNTVGPHCQGIEITNGSMNEVGSGCTQINIHSSERCLIGSNCNSITFDSPPLPGKPSTAKCTVGARCTDITIKNAQYVEVGGDCHHVDIENSHYSSIAALCTNLLIQNCDRNTIGNECHNFKLVSSNQNIIESFNVGGYLDGYELKIAHTTIKTNTNPALFSYNNIDVPPYTEAAPGDPNYNPGYDHTVSGNSRWPLNIGSHGASKVLKRRFTSEGINTYGYGVTGFEYVEENVNAWGDSIIARTSIKNPAGNEELVNP